MGVRPGPSQGRPKSRRRSTTRRWRCSPRSTGELVAIVMVDGRVRAVCLGPMQPILDCATAITMTLQRLARHVVTEVRAVAELDLLMTLGWQLEALIVRPLDIDAERTWSSCPQPGSTRPRGARARRCGARRSPSSHRRRCGCGPDRAGAEGATRRVLVAGPRLADGHDEVTRLRTAMPDAVVLAGDDASPSRVRSRPPMAPASRTSLRTTRPAAGTRCSHRSSSPVAMSTYRTLPG